MTRDEAKLLLTRLDIIRAFAEGADVERVTPDGDVTQVSTPSFIATGEYRVRVPKLTISVEATAYLKSLGYGYIAMDESGYCYAFNSAPRRMRNVWNPAHGDNRTAHRVHDDAVLVRPPRNHWETSARPL